VKKFFLMWVSVSCISARASEILWLKMNENHRYKDLVTDCKSVRPGGDFYFAAEHENGKAIRVVLSNFPNTFPYTHIYKSIELSPQEVAGVELYKDAKDRYWIKKLPLYSPALRWILYWGAERYSFCPLPQLLQTISPSFHSFEFETEGIDEGVLVSYSDKASFVGLRSDGQSYQSDLSLVQREDATPTLP